MLRETVRAFTETEIDPQAIKFNREEKFNRPLFNKCGELGLLGVTVDAEVIYPKKKVHLPLSSD
jgi:isovaleryl-CoA dehydrogenase